MQAYTLHDPRVLALLACIALLEVVGGYAVGRWIPRGVARWIAWAATVALVAVVERLLAHEPAGLRMLAFIVVAMLALKIVVLVEEPREQRGFPFWAWLGFALGWPGMRPRLFAQRGARPLIGVRRLITVGAAYFVAGGVLLCASRFWAQTTHERWSSTAIFFLGSSLMVHFGLFDLMAGAWRAAGVACEELFRAPWLAQSLSEFWARRWNLAFSEMTSIAIYRPLSGAIGRNAAMFAAFVVSGLLHEMAISLPVRAGFGLPTAYFALHGVLVWVERALVRRGTPMSGVLGRVWTLGWLIAPLPILFHHAFLAGVVWPLLGVD